jgi:hypothetical protein
MHHTANPMTPAAIPHRRIDNPPVVYPISTCTQL